MFLWERPTNKTPRETLNLIIIRVEESEAEITGDGDDLSNKNFSESRISAKENKDKHLVNSTLNSWNL